MNHKEEALGNLTGWNGLPNERRIDLAIQEAQVHATLYLAEQQRIANLIAVASMEGDVFSPLSEGSPFTPVFEGILEGLALR